MEGEKKKGLMLLCVVRISDRACLASHAAAGSGYKATAIQELLAARAAPPAPERKTTAEGEAHAVHFVADAKGLLLYAVVTAPAYPSRVAFACLDELRHGVEARFDPGALLGAKENGAALKASLKPLLKELQARFDDPAQADRVLHVQAKVDVVVETMQDSLQVLLQNDAKLQSLEQASEALTAQAKVFQAKTSQLRRTMKCEEWRWRIMVALLICVVLLVVVTPVVMAAEKREKLDLSAAAAGAAEAPGGQEKTTGA